DANQGDENAGGISNSASLDMTSSTVSGNSTGSSSAPRPGDEAAGGIRNSARLTISFSTVAYNQGSGIINDPCGAVVFSNTILAGNVASYADGSGVLPFDCSGALRSLGHHLIGVVDSHSACTVSRGYGDQIGLDRAAPIDPKLAPLAANGGYTQTQALLVGSPAIDRADTSGSQCPIDDQRGIIRR